MLVFVMGLALLGILPSPAAADFFQMNQMTGLTLEKKFGPHIMLNQTLFNVKIPLAISNMPGPWKYATLKAFVIVYFLNGAGEATGMAFGEKGEEFLPLGVTLDNGSYNGTVVFPIRTSAGAITGKNCCLTLVVAEMGNQLMVIGASKGGTAPNAGACAGAIFDQYEPGSILGDLER
jgi:hypothetical protein